MIAGGVQVVNAGLPLIVEGVPAADVTQLDWRPPAFSDVAAARAMIALDDETTAAANAAAIAAVHAVRPRVEGIRPARAVIDALEGPGRTILHAGPPIAWARMCGPMRGAAIGAILFEGWATTPEEAGGRWTRARSSSRRATTTARSARWRASSPPRCRSRRRERRRGKRLRDPQRGARQGAPLRRVRPEVLDRLRWMAEMLGPALDAAIRASAPIDLKRYRAGARDGRRRPQPQRGRHVALARRLAPALAPLDGGPSRCSLPARQRPLLPEPVDGRLQASLDAAHGVADRPW